MAVSSFGELAEHVGHEVAVVTYGQRAPEVAAADNVAVECITCAAVLLDLDKTDTPEAPPYKLAEATLSVQPPLAEAQFRRLEELTGRQPERFKDWAPSFHFALPLTTDPNSSPAVAYAREQALPHQVEIVSSWL